MSSDELGEVLEVITNLAREAAAGDGTGTIPARVERSGKGRLHCRFYP